MPTRNAARRPANSLPAAPPARVLHMPASRPAGVVDPTVAPEARWYVGLPSIPSPTARFFLSLTYVRDGVQTLLYAGARFWLWSGEPPAWQPMDPERLEATFYNLLREHRWDATPKHVGALIKVAKWELCWPPPEPRRAV